MASRTLDVRLNATDNMSPAFKKAGDSAKNLGDSLNNIGKKSGGFGGFLDQVRALDSEITSVGQAMTGMGAAITATLAVPMAAGTKAAWNQVDAVQQATIALRAYESDASKVNQVLEELVAYARSDMGVLFQRQDLFAAAQGLKVMGAETENLVRYVEIMSRSVAVGAGTWQELGEVIGRVGSTGQLTGIEFDNLTKMGFQLDDSLRNATVSWEQLFDALDAGIPQVGGNVDTIQGQIIRFQSAVRSLGLAILQVDADTSQFIEGGFGDQLYDGIGRAREVMLSLVPVAEGVGAGLAAAASVASGAVDVFLALPDSVQTAVAGLTGLAGVTLTVGGAFLLALPRIAATREAIQALGGVSGIARAGISGLGAVFSPLGLAMAGVAAFGVSLIDLWLDQRSAAEELNASLLTLDDTLEMIRRRGDEQLAATGQTVKNQIIEIEDLLDDFGEAEMPNPLDFTSNIEYQQAVNEHLNNTDAIREASLLAAPAIAAFNAALNDPNVDADAYALHVQGMLELAAATETTEDDIAALNWIIESQNNMPTEFLTNYTTGLEEMGETARATANEVRDALGDIAYALDDLRIEGKGPLADQLDTLHTQWVDAFTFSDQEIAAANAGYLRMLPDEDAQAAIAHMAMQTDLSVEKTEALGSAWERVSSVMQSGNIDNAALMEDVYAILNDTTLSVDEQADALILLSQNLDQYVDKFGGLKSMMVDWLADGDHFLDWWQAFDSVLIDHYGGVQNAGAAWQSFRENVVPTADAIDDANASFDQVLRTFDQIDQLAQRPQGAASIAENLVGTPGEWAAIDDLLDSGRISLDQYYATVESGYAIIDSAAASHMILNEIRADQLPLLEAETLAYQQNLEAIAALEPAEQRRVLMLQDTAVQAQVAELYSTAYAASLGQIPPEVATQMILNAADADAGLKDLLLNLGLISEIDGEIRVNFPDADQTIQAIDRVTHSVLLLSDLMDDGEINGSIKLTIEGDEELQETYGFLLEVDETDVEATATVTADVDPAKTAFAGIAASLLNLDGQSATVYQLGDNSDAIGNIDAVAADLADLDGDSATVYINAVNNAGAEIGSVASQLWALDGQSATVTTNYVTRYSTIGPTAQHGGIPSYATGGVVFRGAEGNRPELAHFANGGTALLPRDGLYAAPPMTYISPHNSTTSYGGDINITIYHQGGDVDSFDDMVETKLVPAMENALNQRRRGYGLGVVA